MGNCIQRNDKVTPKWNDSHDFTSIGSVHTIRNLKDLHIDFIDDTPRHYSVKCVDTLRVGEVSV